MTAEVVGDLSASRHIGIVATQGTVSSRTYEMEIAKLYPDIRVTGQACPMWVPLVENKEFESDGADFFIRRDLMLSHPFDERFRHYGYEDVLFGKQMEQHAIPIVHIDNPLSFEIFETNADFVSKTEEGLRTLHQFRDELQGYSRLLTWSSSTKVSLLRPLIRLCHSLFGKSIRQELTGTRPSLLLFKLYKLGYYLSL